MNFTVFLGNLPTWVTADDIKAWLTAENLVADSVKVIRNHETQESKGFAFVEAPTADEMQAIIRRFDRAPLEDRLLRAGAWHAPLFVRGHVDPVELLLTVGVLQLRVKENARIARVRLFRIDEELKSRRTPRKRSSSKPSRAKRK